MTHNTNITFGRPSNPDRLVIKYGGLSHGMVNASLRTWPRPPPQRFFASLAPPQNIVWPDRVNLADLILKFVYVRVNNGGRLSGLNFVYVHVNLAHRA